MRKTLAGAAAAVLAVVAVSSSSGAVGDPHLDFRAIPDTVPASYTLVDGFPYWCVDRATADDYDIETDGAALICEPVVLVTLDYPDGVIVAIDAPTIGQ